MKKEEEVIVSCTHCLVCSVKLSKEDQEKLNAKNIVVKTCAVCGTDLYYCEY